MIYPFSSQNLQLEMLTYLCYSITILSIKEVKSLSKISNNRITLIVVLAITTVFIISSICYAYEEYIVKPGDSLFKISKRFNANITDLANINNITNPNIIYVNQIIKISSTNKTNTSSDTKKDYKTKEDNTTSATYSKEDWRTNDEVVKATPKESIKRIYRRGPNTMKIAITFDDGPDAKFTPQILNVLKKYNIKATFFLMGERSAQHQEVVKRIIKEGHTIGNHSWSHPNLVNLTDEELEEEVFKTERIIKEITNRETALIRPPYGAVSDKLLDKLQNMNYKVIHWSIDSLDWQAKTAKEVINNTLPNIHTGAVILFHSAGGKGQSLTPTINALPTIIADLQEKELEFVTVDNLLSIGAYKG